MQWNLVNTDSLFVCVCQRKDLSQRQAFAYVVNLSLCGCVCLATVYIWVFKLKLNAFACKQSEAQTHNNHTQVSHVCVCVCEFGNKPQTNCFVSSETKATTDLTLLCTEQVMVGYVSEWVCVSICMFMCVCVCGLQAMLLQHKNAILQVEGAATNPLCSNYALHWTHNTTTTGSCKPGRVR